MADVEIRVTDGAFWHRAGDTAVRGRAFLDGRLLRPPDLLELIAATPIAELERVVSELNGFFSVVRRSGDRVHLAVDHVRSYPVFYATSDGTAFVSDDAHWVKERVDARRTDPLLEYEFLLTGYVTGPDTLYPEIRQVEAGSYVVVDASSDDASATTSRYSWFEHRPPREATEAELLAELDEVVVAAFERLVEIADGRQLVVSLSGGPDSRLIACMLRRLDYPKLRAFTYGQAGNRDATVAESVARALDVPIDVVPYDHETWHEWFHSEERHDYYRYAFQFSDIPNIGTVPAMGRLADSGAIDDDAILLCGNLAPSENDYPVEMRRAAPSTEAELAAFIVDRFYKHWTWDDEAATAFRSRVESQLSFDHPGADGGAGADGEAAAVAAYKDWRIRNINAKLMIAPEEYAFHGHDAWTVLWDEAYTNFWQRVPIEYRNGKRLHRTYVRRLYEEQTGERLPEDDGSEGLLRRLEAAVVDSPLEPLARLAYAPVEKTYQRLTMESPYDANPVGTLGIMPEEQFETLCRSYYQTVHPFKALEALGCVSFDPPANHSGPVDGHLELDRLRTPEHARRRESLPWF